MSHGKIASGDKDLLSVVIPVYMGKSMFSELIDRLEAEMIYLKLNYEIILVEDGCPQRTWDVIAQAARDNVRIKAIKLSRNFGQHNAINAGLRHVNGDWIIVMDCDLQDRPEEIRHLYSEARKGNDIVFASRAVRRDGWLKRTGSRFFYKIFSVLIGVNFDGSIGNFGIYSRKVIDQYNKMNESGKAFAPMMRWMGFKNTKVEVEHSKRAEGKSSYSFTRLLRLALGIIISYSDRPLRMTINIGFSISSLSVFFVIYSFWSYFSGKTLVPGYASIIASIWFFSGLIIFTLGVIGLYLSKTFENVKGRRDFIIDETINL